jgi:hypothetical protein
MKTYYKAHVANGDRANDFTLFLNQCKRAVDKIYGFKVGIDEELWSMESKEIGETFWQQLKRSGELSYNDEFIVIDFEYDRNVYAESKQ